MRKNEPLPGYSTSLLLVLCVEQRLLYEASYMVNIPKTSRRVLAQSGLWYRNILIQIDGSLTLVWACYISN